MLQLALDSRHSFPKRTNLVSQGIDLVAKLPYCRDEGLDGLRHRGDARFDSCYPLGKFRWHTAIITAARRVVNGLIGGSFGPTPERIEINYVCRHYHFSRSSSASAICR